MSVQGLMNLLVGVGILWMSLFTPFVLFKLFAFVDRTTDAGASIRNWLRGLGVDSYGDPLAGQGNPAAKAETNAAHNAFPGLFGGGDVENDGDGGGGPRRSGGGSGSGGGEEATESAHEARFDSQSTDDVAGPAKTGAAAAATGGPATAAETAAGAAAEAGADEAADAAADPGDDENQAVEAPAGGGSEGDDDPWATWDGSGTGPQGHTFFDRYAWKYGKSSSGAGNDGGGGGDAGGGDAPAPPGSEPPPPTSGVRPDGAPDLHTGGHTTGSAPSGGSPGGGQPSGEVEPPGVEDAPRPAANRGQIVASANYGSGAAQRAARAAAFDDDHHSTAVDPPGGEPPVDQSTGDGTSDGFAQQPDDPGMSAADPGVSQ